MADVDITLGCDAEELKQGLQQSAAAVDQFSTHAETAGGGASTGLEKVATASREVTQAATQAGGGMVALGQASQAASAGAQQVGSAVGQAATQIAQGASASEAAASGLEGLAGMGGPIGLAIGAAAGAFFFFKRQIDDVNEAAKEARETLSRPLELQLNLSPKEIAAEIKLLDKDIENLKDKTEGFGAKLTSFFLSGPLLGDPLFQGKEALKDEKERKKQLQHGLADSELEEANIKAIEATEGPHAARLAKIDSEEKREVAKLHLGVKPGDDPLDLDKREEAIHVESAAARAIENQKEEKKTSGKNELDVGGADRESKRIAEQEQREIDRLRKQSAEEERRQHLAALEPLERKKELEAEAASLREREGAATGEKEKLELKIQELHATKEIAAVEKEIARDEAKEEKDRLRSSAVGPQSHREAVPHSPHSDHELTAAEFAKQKDLQERKGRGAYNQTEDANASGFTDVHRGIDGKIVSAVNKLGQRVSPSEDKSLAQHVDETDPTKKPKLKTTGLETHGLGPALSDDDFHSQFAQHGASQTSADWRKQFQATHGLDRASQVKDAMKDKDGKGGAAEKHQEKAVTLLEKIEKNTQDIGANK